METNKHVKPLRWFEHTQENAKSLRSKRKNLTCICGQKIVVGGIYGVVVIRKATKEEQAASDGQTDMIGAVVHRECFDGFVKSALLGVREEMVRLEKKSRGKRKKS